MVNPRPRSSPIAPPSIADTPFRVAVLLGEGVLATSATLPVEIFRNAEAFAAQALSNHRKIEIATITVDGSAISSASGFDLTPSASLDPYTSYDLIHIPGFWRNPRQALRNSCEYLPWLQRQHESGATLSAVGTGVCFFAEAGLLDGKPATTHWHYFDRFQKQYPKVQLQRQYFTTQADNIYCAAGINALAELLSHIVFRIYGRATAQYLERVFFHEIRNTFEGKEYFQEQTRLHPDEAILQAQLWIQDNVAKPVTVTHIAKQFGMSTRTFNRRFRHAVGKSALEFLQTIRTDNARQLLKNSNLSIGEISHLCGYQDAGWFAQLFRKHHNVTPAQYRQTVRAKLFRTD